MNRVVSSALGVAVALAAFYAVKTLRQEAANREPTATQVSRQMTDIATRAQNEYPDMAITDATKKVAAKDTAAKMASQTPQQQINTAADTFWGFYYVNTEVRTDYCAERGVDLAPYVAAFKKEHGEALRKATAIYAEAGVPPENHIPLLRTSLAAFIEQDMKDFTMGARVPLEQACTLFNENAELLADLVQLPPEVKQALLSYN